MNQCVRASATSVLGKMLKKRIGLAVLVVVLIGCAVHSSHRSPPVSLPPTVTASMSWSDSLEAIEAAGIRAADGRVSRVGPELRIHLRNGTTSVFTSDTTPDQFQLPRYAGYSKELHSYFVHILPYEGSGNFHIVDDSTGAATIVWGMPVPSPDGSRFVLTSQSGEADYDKSVIEVWRMVGGKPENEFSYDSGENSWDPSDARWRDSSTIEFVKNSRKPPYPTSRGRLVRSGTTWTFTEPAQ
jgi:hypothetical protein